MSEGELLKPEKDFTKETDEQLSEAEKLAKVRRWPQRQRVQSQTTKCSTDQPSRCCREAHGARETDPTSKYDDIGLRQRSLINNRHPT